MTETIFVTFVNITLENGFYFFEIYNYYENLH